MNCLVCGEVLDAALAPEPTHPACSPTSYWFDEQPGEAFNANLKQRLIGMALWANREAPRSKQQRIGPSEIGHPCDRRVAYKLAQTPAVNVGFDPWPAVVGTAVHHWLESAVRNYESAHGTEEWLTETTLEIDEFIEGHSDLYWNGTVIDWKTAGPEVMKKIRDEGPPNHYIVQAQVYGLGFLQRGFAVDRVALAFVPRAGWLRDMFVWSTQFSKDIAEAALARVYDLAAVALTLDVINRPHRWEQIPATPGDHCGVCPWFNSLRSPEEGASNLGCPGQ